MIYRSIREMVEDQTVLSITPETSVHQAAVLMMTHRIGALPVMRGTELIGIFTERDLVSRVVAPRLNPDHTPVAQVMTVEPKTIVADKTLCDALDLMYAHLSQLNKSVDLSSILTKVKKMSKKSPAIQIMFVE